MIILILPILSIATALAAAWLNWMGQRARPKHLALHEPQIELSFTKRYGTVTAITLEAKKIGFVDLAGSRGGSGSF